MPIYVARVERNGKPLLDRADVTVELLEDGGWRGRFFLTPGLSLAKGAKVELSFFDGRQGKAVVDHLHPTSSKTSPRLVEITGVGPLE
jgi:hypothetical protein